MTNKEKHDAVQQQDFQADSLLYQVAQKDVDLACRLSEEFGGTSQYIQQLDK